jgi:hypothetical protein
MSDVKTINISGMAAKDLTGGKRTRRTAKKKQDGGSEEVRGVSPIMTAVKGVESPSQIAETAASPNSNSWLKYPVGAPIPPKIMPSPSHIPVSPDKSAAPFQQGGTKQVKVELKKKTSAKKVNLNPKKAEPQKHLSKHKTRRVRKVTLGISSLHKRITHAKKLHKTVKEMPIDKLKEKLVKGGLIKANSKAPESVLRQIAGDAEVVAKKAL